MRVLCLASTQCAPLVAACLEASASLPAAMAFGCVTAAGLKSSQRQQCCNLTGLEAHCQGRTPDCLFSGLVACTSMLMVYVTRCCQATTRAALHVKLPAALQHEPLTHLMLNAVCTHPYHDRPL